MQIEQQRVAIEDREARDKKDYNDKQIKIKEDQLKVEMAQLTDGNPYNDKLHD